jgi:anti-sigma28 factor (negative regulator of flagellin synthesis)
MGHKENKKSKHNGYSKDTAKPNASKSLSDQEMPVLDGGEPNSLARAERLKKKIYESELEMLQTQLVKMK